MSALLIEKGDPWTLLVLTELGIVSIDLHSATVHLQKHCRSILSRASDPAIFSAISTSFTICQEYTKLEAVMSVDGMLPET